MRIALVVSRSAQSVPETFGRSTRKYFRTIAPSRPYRRSDDQSRPERFMAKRMGAKTIEVKASHLALISRPDAITNLILQALAV